MKVRSNKTYAVLAMLSMCVMMFCWTGIGWNTLSLYAGDVVSEIGCSRTQFLMCVTLVSMGNALVSMFLYGWIVEKLGMRKYLLASGLLSTAGFVVMALAGSIAVLWLGAGMFGIGLGGLSVNTINVVIGQWYRKNIVKLCGIGQTCGAVAGIIFSSIWGAIISSLGWRIPLWITAGISALCTIVMVSLYKGKPGDVGASPMYADEVGKDSDEAGKDSEDGVPYKEIFKTKQFYLLCLCYLLISIVTYAIYTNLVLLAADLGYGDQSGTILSVALIAMTASFLILGSVVDKYGSKWAVAFNVVLLIIGGIIFMRDSVPLYLVYVGGALLGFATSAAQLPVGASVREALGTKDFSKKLGLVAAFDYMGASLGGIVLSVFYDVFGNYKVGIVVTCIAALITALLFFPATKRVSYKSQNQKK